MSECGVCIGNHCSFEFIDYRNTKEVALIEMQCEECRRVIPAGAEYEDAGGEDEDGDEHTYATCLDCVNIANGLSCNGDRVHSMLWDDLEESGGFENFSEACMAKVATVSAKKYLRDRWLKWKGLA